jgi:TrmH family RNA methyltransferase
MLITSLTNPIIKNACSLQEKKYRQEQQRFLLEGYHTIDEAIKTNLVDTILVTKEEDCKKYEGYCKSILQVTPQIIKKLSTTLNPQPIVAIVKMLNHEFRTEDELFQKEKLRIAILDQIQDPGNLGTLIRTACGLGFDAILASPTCVDLYNEKVLRATQGTLFKIPYYISDLTVAIASLKQLGFTLVGTALKQSIDLKELKQTSKMGVCFGNEAHGVSEEVLNQMDYRVRLPMKRDVESLNVTIASSIVMYELTKE